MRVADIYQQYHNHVSHDPVGWQMHHSDAQSLIAQRQQAEMRNRVQVNQFDGGMILARTTAQGAGAYDVQVGEFHHNCAVFMLLAGHNQIILPDGEHFSIKTGQICFAQGNWLGIKERIALSHGHLAAINTEHDRDCAFIL